MGDETVEFVPWIKIGGLHNIVSSMTKSLAWHKENNDGGFAPYRIGWDKLVAYRGKIKLHGENGGIVLESGGRMRIQSRNQQLDKKKMHGEIVFAKENEEYFRSLFDEKAGYKRMSIFGEWCGPGVQKGVALASIPKKIFVVFSVQLDDRVVVEPDDLINILTRGGKVKLPDRVYVLPWFTEVFSLHFLDEKQMEDPVEKMNAMVMAIDKLDPWVETTFKVKGPGEGLVLYPLTFQDQKDRTITVEMLEGFCFKAKGDEHRVVATKQAVQTKPEVAGDTQSFAKMMLTPARLEQGAKATGDLDKKNTGKFVQWIKTDVEKEGKAELEASNMQWKDVQGAVTKMAQAWYAEQCTKSS